MKKQMENLRNGVDDMLRKACGRIDPDRRMGIIITAFAVFACASLYIFVRAIYAIGKDDGRKEIAIEHIKQLPLSSMDKNADTGDALNIGESAGISIGAGLKLGSIIDSMSLINNLNNLNNPLYEHK